MLETMASIANVIPHLVEIKQEVLVEHINIQFLFIGAILLTRMERL
jgi:hypothetical protein